MSGIIDDLELNKFKKTIIQRIENQELDLVLDPLFNCICDRVTYERNKGIIEWECAICGKKIFTDKRRNDVENFVCDDCKELYNNNNMVVDRRILDSRTKMFKMMENALYDELETKLNL
jgi:hypothetical protein